MAKLKENIKIRSTEIKNRLVMPPMATSNCKEDGIITEDLINYYDDRAKSGHIGMIITEHAYITQQGKASLNQMSIADDSTIEGLTKLARTIKQSGSTAIIQINHAGSRTNEETTGMNPVGPSAVDHPAVEKFRLSEAEALTKEGIDEIVQLFAQAAKRAEQAGFDGVEVHSAHGYLLNQFYSPLANKRVDEYGTSQIQSRVRFHKEVLQAIRRVVSDDFIVGLRLGACDYKLGGSSVEDGVRAVRHLDSYIDYIHITGGIFGYTTARLEGAGYFRDASMALKEDGTIKAPVILTGGVKTLDAANKVLEDDYADMVGVGRAILKDAHWADEAFEK